MSEELEEEITKLSEKKVELEKAEQKAAILLVNMGRTLSGLINSRTDKESDMSFDSVTAYRNELYRDYEIMKEVLADTRAELKLVIATYKKAKEDLMIISYGKEMWAERESRKKNRDNDG